MRLHSFWPVVTACVILLAGCSPAGQPGSPADARAGADRAAQPKRLIVAAREASSFLIDQLGESGDVVEELVSAGLVRFTPLGEAVPLMAEAVPSLDNNLLKVFPDGRMETTWRMKEGLRWHDGTPLTTDDLLFAVRVGQDRELPDFGHVAFRSLESVRAVDARTIVAEWKEPYIQYDIMFSWQVALPLPKHLLEDTYLNNKETFILHRYWASNEFVHAGPFRVREFLPAERLVVEANPDFVLGRPKVDEIEVRFIPDANTFIANLLAGEVHFSIGSGVTVGQAKQAADQWPGGKMGVYPIQSAKTAVPQFTNPDPPIQLDVRFRRALAHAFDREALNELINVGVAPPPSGFMVPVGAPEFPAIRPSIVEYPFDPRRAAQLIEEIGYTRVGDTYRDPTGKELSVQYLTTQGGAEEQAALFILDSWKQVGVRGVADIRATAAIDREVRANRPAFVDGTGTFMMTQPRRLEWLHSRELPTSANRFRGNNRARYASPELDALIDRFFVTIPPQERIELLKQVAHQWSDQVVAIMAYHTVHATLMNNRVQNVTPRTGLAQAWDNHTWDIR